MANKVVVIIFLTGCLLNIGLGQECPTSSEDVLSWANIVFADCMRDAVRTLRLSKDNCRHVMNNTVVCIYTAEEECNANQPTDVVTAIETTISLSVVGVGIYTPIFCDNDLSILPEIGNVPDMNIPGCSENYLTELAKCSETVLSIFREDPLDERLCEENNNMAKCETDTSRELCTIFTEEDLRQSEQAQRDGNFYCTDTSSTAADSQKSSILATHVISLIYMLCVWSD